MYEEVVEASACGPERPLACLYDFLAIGSRAGAVLGGSLPGGAGQWAL